MKKYHEKYKTQVQFVSIACNDREEAWKNAINKYGLAWTQLLNDEKSSNNVAGLYGINKFPTKILIDPFGSIVLRFIGEGEAFYKKIDEILNKPR